MERTQVKVDKLQKKVVKTPTNLGRSQLKEGRKKSKILKMNQVLVVESNKK